MIVVAGEALIDLVPVGDRLRPLAGGSPYNVAVGLGRLEVPVAFLGALSTDGFGQQLRSGLVGAGVSLELAVEVAEPTTLAVVHLDAGGHAEYGFYLAATSSTSLPAERLPPLPVEDAPVHVSLGAVTLDQDPAGAALRRLLARERSRRLRCLDPNVRPAMVADVSQYARVLEEALTDCEVVKVSDDDLATLYPDSAPEAVATRWATAGPLLVVVTRGGDGAVAFGPAGRVEVPAPRVEVVDTVGAGDAFTSGLLAGLWDAGVTTSDALRGLDDGGLRSVLEWAAVVAAVTCTRQGADPPTRAELAPLRL